MNPRVNKISQEIEKIKSKITDYQNRLKTLERQKTELENSDIVALVRGVDVPPDELLAFIEAIKTNKGLSSQATQKYENKSKDIEEDEDVI
jgi:flagellar biosynthesis chaperone FliJ